MYNGALPQRCVFNEEGIREHYKSHPQTLCPPPPVPPQILAAPSRVHTGGLPCAQTSVHIPSRTCALLLLVDVLVSRGRLHDLALQTRPQPSTAPAITQQVSPEQDPLLNVMFVDLILLPGSQSPSLPSDVRALPRWPVHITPTWFEPMTRPGPSAQKAVSTVSPSGGTSLIPAGLELSTPACSGASRRKLAAVLSVPRAA